jgi:hypothetical protein
MPADKREYNNERNMIVSKTLDACLRRHDVVEGVFD